MSKNVKNDYRSTFLGLPVSTAHYDELMDFLRKPTTATEEKYVDGKIYKALKQLLEEAPYDNKELINLLEEAKDDERITKKFNSPMKQYENIKPFLAQEKRDMRWNRNYRTSRDILRVSILKNMSRKLTILDVNNEEDVLRAFSNLNASCGAVAPGKKKKDKLDLIVEVAKYLLEHPEHEGIPALTFKRSQISNFIIDGKLDSSNIKKKYRLVWCVDAATVLVEALYARPLMDVILPSIINYAGGKSDDSIGEILLSWWSQCNNWICFDYSAYDSTVPSWLIQDMFDMLKCYFTRESWETLDWVADKFINTRIIMPEGEIYQKHHGIPSGSYFTQIIGTLCNLQVMLTAFVAIYGETEAKRKLTARSGHLMLMAMGDDNVVFCRGEIDVDSISSYIHKNFGLNINPAKCDKGGSSDYPVFLKRQWTPRGANRDIKELLVQMIHPEFWRTYDNYSPYHIIYGYYLCYPLAFERVIDVHKIIIKMHEQGGVDKLLGIRRVDLPGSLRYLAISDPRRWREKVKAAQDTVKSILAKQTA